MGIILPHNKYLSSIWFVNHETIGLYIDFSSKDRSWGCFSARMELKPIKTVEMTRKVNKRVETL
jgi:hypothetical protein